MLGGMHFLWSDVAIATTHRLTRRCGLLSHCILTSTIIRLLWLHQRPLCTSCPVVCTSSMQRGIGNYYSVVSRFLFALLRQRRWCICFGQKIGLLELIRMIAWGV